MKQFQYSKPGSVFAMGPYDREEAENLVFALSEWLDTAEVGDTAADTDGDIWVRLPDIKTADDKQRDERLERIATAAMAAIIGKLPLTVDAGATESNAMAARGAINYAKALIAELDKQA